MKFDLRDREWLDDAACANLEKSKIDIFFPPRDKDLYRVIADEAKTYCNGGAGKAPCPVRLRCLWQAIETDEQHGIWGGMSHRERNAFVRKWQKHYKSTMTLEEYILQVKGKDNGSN